MSENEGNGKFYRDTIEDMGAEKYQLEDPMTFWNTEKKDLWKKMLGRTELPFVLMGIGLVLVVIVFFAFFPRGGEEGAFQDSAAVSDRLIQLEDKIATMQTAIEGFSMIEQEMEPMKKAILRFDGTEESLSSEIEQMAGKLASLQMEMKEIKKGLLAAAKQPVSSQEGAKEETSPAVDYYEVRKGDTLYGISRRYGVSVDILRKLNGLSGQDAIQPGQKLRVKE